MIDTKQRILTIVQNVLDNSEVNLEDDFFDTLMLDSIALMEIISGIEEEFAIDFSLLDGWLGYFENCEKLAEFVDEISQKQR